MNKSGVILVAYLIIVGMSCQAQQIVKSKLFEDFKNAPLESPLPDFSFAGYKNGESGIPSPNYKIFNVVDYGAIPNDMISDRIAIEKAIKAASDNGSGIVFFPKGKFLINEDGDAHTSIMIQSGKVILRGSGSGEAGTQLFMKNTLLPLNPDQMWTTPPMFIFGSSQKNERIGGIIADAETGTHQITVDNVSRVTPGDWIILQMNSKDPDLIQSELGKHTPDTAWSLTKTGVNLNIFYQITHISKNTLTLYTPITYHIKAANHWKVYKANPIKEIGIEDIAFCGNWHGKFVHHRSWIDDSGWSIINLRSIVNSWIENCRFTDVCSAATVSTGANISILSCQVTGNPGHEAITNSGGSNVLLGYLTDEASMWHSFGTAGPAMNTVLWHVKYPASTCFESHSSQPRNTLLDNVEGGLLINRGGGALSNMPNHMQKLIFWNYYQTNKKVTDFEFWPIGEPWYWRIPDPILVGFYGQHSTFNMKQISSYSELIDQKAYPLSLYEAQLKLRTGKVPKWIEKLQKNQL